MSFERDMDKEIPKKPTRNSNTPTVRYNLTALKRLLLIKKTVPQKQGGQSHSRFPGTTLRSSLSLPKKPTLKGTGTGTNTRDRNGYVQEQYKEIQVEIEPNAVQSDPSRSERIVDPLRKTQETIERVNNTTEELDNSMVPTMLLQDLQKHTYRWLMRTGRSIRKFHHLLTYNPPSGENKENVEVDDTSRSYSDLGILPKENVMSFSIVRALLALRDLRVLINEGFSVEYGIQWLELIEYNNDHLLQHSSFWLRKGGILEVGGKILLAVQCYKMASTFGAKREIVFQCLDGILENFCFAVINLKKLPPGTKLLKHQMRMIDEVKDIFRKAVDIFP